MKHGTAGSASIGMIRARHRAVLTRMFRSEPTFIRQEALIHTVAKHISRPLADGVQYCIDLWHMPMCEVWMGRSVWCWRYTLAGFEQPFLLVDNAIPAVLFNLMHDGTEKIEPGKTREFLSDRVERGVAKYYPSLADAIEALGLALETLRGQTAKTSGDI